MMGLFKAVLPVLVLLALFVLGVHLVKFLIVRVMGQK